MQIVTHLNNDLRTRSHIQIAPLSPAVAKIELSGENLNSKFTVDVAKIKMISTCTL